MRAARTTARPRVPSSRGGLPGEPGSAASAGAPLARIADDDRLSPQGASPGAVPARYVVSRRWTGWGDCIVSLISAWHYARRTGRTLAVDWRRSRYLADPRRNAFAAYFEPCGAIAGVPVMGDDSVGRLAYPRPVHRSAGHLALEGLRAWQARRGLRPSAEQAEAAYRQAHAEELSLLAGEDCGAATVILECCLSEALPDLASCGTFLAGLVPRPAIRAEVDRFAAAHFSSRPVIAVHVRHGNGDEIGEHAKYWRDPERDLSAVCDGIREAETALGGAGTIFLCTDSARIRDQILARRPGILTRRKHFRADGSGELHAAGLLALRRWRVGRDALVEMLLLARADALVCYPPDSFFSFYARACADGPRLLIADRFRLSRA